MSTTALDGAATGEKDAPVADAGHWQDKIVELEKAVLDAKKDLAMRVKHYEGKLVTMTVINSALQSENEKLKEEIATCLRDPTDAERELAELEAEFTKRLGAADRTASAMRDECFSLRESLEASKKANEQTLKAVQDKEAAITQYVAEGEKLAKKTLELEAIIRKLRSDNSRVEQEKEKLVARVQVLEAAARSEEISRSASVEELSQELEATKQTLAEQNAYFTKLVEEERAASAKELKRMQEKLQEQGSASHQRMLEREQLLSSQLDALRQSLAQANQAASEREDVLREEIREKEARVRRMEMEKEDIEARLSESTRPLIRQMEGLSLQLAEKERGVMERERDLMMRAEAAEAMAGAAAEGQRKAEAQAAAAERRVAVAERDSATMRKDMLAAQKIVRDGEQEMKTLRERCAAALETATVAEQGREEAMAAMASLRLAKEDAERSLRVMKLEMEEEFETERRLWEVERAGYKQQQQVASARPATSDSNGDEASSSGLSRSESLEREELLSMSGGGSGMSMSVSVSRSGSLSRKGSLLLQDSQRFTDLLADASPSSGKAASSATSALANERLLAKIRQMQGEVSHLQRELNAAQAARNHASDELLKVTQRLHDLQKEEDAGPKLRAELAELQRRHDMALVIIGEHKERADELEADMVDVKALYREQVNLLVSQIDPEQWPKGYRICLFCSHCAQVQSSNKRGTGGGNASTK